MNFLPFFSVGQPDLTYVIGGIAAWFFVFFMFVAIWASRYTKVGPDEVLVVSGRNYMVKDPEGKVHTVGSRIVIGGGTFVWPVYEKCSVLSLKPVSVDLAVTGILTRDGGSVEVAAKFQVKIRPDDVFLARAAESLLGKTLDEVKDTARQLMESSLRSLLGGWTAEEVSGKQSQLAGEWQKSAEERLGYLGLVLMSLSVREVKLSTQGQAERLP
jgi:flotillin